MLLNGVGPSLNGIQFNCELDFGEKLEKAREEATGILWAFFVCVFVYFIFY